MATAFCSIQEMTRLKGSSFTPTPNRSARA